MVSDNPTPSKLTSRNWQSKPIVQSQVESSLYVLDWWKHMNFAILSRLGHSSREFTPGRKSEYPGNDGGVAERLNALVLKTSKG